MIYNRTLEDVANAKNIFTEKVTNSIPLTDEEKDIMERGMVTADTLNRIEQKQAEIGLFLNNWHYIKEPIINKQWSDEVFFKEDLQRLTENTIKLREAFYVLSKDLPNPEARYYFEDFNTMEKLLAEISLLVFATKQSFKRSGAVYANQSILPLKGVI